MSSVTWSLQRIGTGAVGHRGNGIWGMSESGVVVCCPCSCRIQVSCAASVWLASRCSLLKSYRVLRIALLLVRFAQVIGHQVVGREKDYFEGVT